MTDATGGCLCGSVRYTLSADPVMSAACHCKNCQKQTGSAYSVIIGVPENSVTVEGDSLKTFSDTGDSGLPVLRKFCSECGSPVLTEVKAFEGLLFIKAGTLDDPSTVEIGAEIWCDSKQPYAVLGDTLPGFPGNPPAS